MNEVIAFYIEYDNGSATIRSMYSDYFKMEDVGILKHKTSYWGDKYEMIVPAHDGEEAKNIFYAALEAEQQKEEKRGK